MQLYNNFIDRIHTPPNNLLSSQYQSWVLINYACTMGGVVHFLFIFLFAIVGVLPLSLLNIASCVIWTFSVYFNLKGFMKTGFIFIQVTKFLTIREMIFIILMKMVMDQQIIHWTIPTLMFLNFDPIL